MSDDLVFRLMFALWAAGAAVTAFAIGRYIIGPGRWTT